MRDNALIRVAPSEVRKAYERTPKDELIDTPRAIATRVGELLKADLMIIGTVWRYKERVGGALPVQSPASVAFAIYVIEVATGKTVWKAKFDETSAHSRKTSWKRKGS